MWSLPLVVIVECGVVPRDAQGSNRPLGIWRGLLLCSGRDPAYNFPGFLVNQQRREYHSILMIVKDVSQDAPFLLGVAHRLNSMIVNRRSKIFAVPPLLVCHLTRTVTVPVYVRISVIKTGEYLMGPSVTFHPET